MSGVRATYLISENGSDGAKRGTVLIVEDSPVQSELLRRTLVAAGYAVLIAPDGAQGLALAEEHRPDAVVSDINMPLMDGYQMCESIRKNDALKSMPVILVTMLADPKDVIQGLRSGADGYLTKPYNAASLISRIESLLASPVTPYRGPDRRIMEVLLDGERYSVQVNNQRMLNLLVSTYENAVIQTRELAATQQALEELNAQLETKVLEKTAALQESEKKYHTLFDEARDGIVLTDGETGFVIDCNSEFVRQSGRILDQLKAMRIWELRPPEKVEAAKKNFFEVKQSESGGADDLELQHPDGTIVPIEFTAKVTCINGRTCIQSICRDITERTKAAARISHLNRLIRSAARINHLIVRERDRDKLLQSACDVLVREAEYPMAWIGTRADGHKRVVPVAQAGFSDGFLDALTITWDEAPTGHGPTGTALRTGKFSIVQDIETDPRCAAWKEAALKRGYHAIAAFPLAADHTLYGALIVYAEKPNAFDDEEIALLDEVSSDIAFALFGIDIEHQRKRSEQALAESQVWFKALIENVSDMTTVIGQDGIISYISPSAKTLGGYEPDDLVGRNIYEFIHPDDAQTAVGDMAKLMRIPGEIHRAELRYRNKDGSWRIFETLTRNLLADPAVHGIVANMRDITERKRVQQEREQDAKRLARSLEETIWAVATTVEMRDPYTAGHQRRVADLAHAIGTELGLSETQIHGLRLAGTIHDLGKIQLPAEILAKPGKLSALEFNLIKSHPQTGYDIVKGVEFPWPIAQAILQHHERLDGSGYPAGLKGEQIIVEARILSVADVVEAMSSHRPYRAGLGMEAALGEIRKNSGKLYDPAVVDACLRLFGDKAYVLPA